MPLPSRRPRIAHTPDGLVIAVRQLDAVTPMLDAWRGLEREALVENLFFEADFTLAAARTFGRGIRILTVSDRPPEMPGARLLALWPCRVVRRWGLPLPALMGWTHGFANFGAPLLAAGEAERGLRALLDAPGRLGLPRRLLMPYLPLDGAFAVLLERVLAETGRRRADFWTHERAFLDLADAAPPLPRGDRVSPLSARKGRQLARFSRRLAAERPVAYETVRDSGTLPQALADYVALEAAGWKGRAGTAVAQRPAEGAFLDALVAAYAREGRVRIDRLRRDGRSLAASLALETRSTFWFLKISHDEAEARNSPGALLVERVTRSLLADGRIAAAESCAPPDFPLIETFWGERRRLAHGLIEAESGDRLFPLAVGMERLRAGATRARTRASGKA